MSREGVSAKPRVFLSYARKDGEKFAARLSKRLETSEPEITLWQDRTKLEGGVGWWKQIEEALDQVKFLVIVMTPAAMESEITRKEWRNARQRGVNVYPVKGCPEAALDYASLPNWMRKAHFFDLDKEWETFVNYLKSDRQPSRVPFMAPDFPEGFVERPREFEQLIAHLVDVKRESPIAITTALQGAGGYGKTTLTLALCHDDRVIGAFDDGILWVTLGQSPNILGELKKLYEALTGDQPDFVDEAQAELKLREKLENRNCLLVIDDVWQRARLEPFLQGGKKTCARLITTRRSDLVMDAKRIQVDEMKPEESVALLASRVPGEKRPCDLQPFRHLAARLMDWPLLLKLAAGVIGARIERGDTFEGAIDYANRAYERRGLTAFDPKDAEKRNDAAAKSIEASLELLDKDERTRLSELAIFPEDTDVPFRMIELLWGLDDLDTQDAARRLADFALLDLDLRVGVVRLLDEIRLFFVRAMGSEAVTLHAGLVDRLGNPKEIRDGYALRWLPWHLGKAGRDTERRALLVNVEWMMAKLKGADIQSLIADYEYLPKEEDLRLVQSALRLSAHILARNPRQLPGQLIGRLLESLTYEIDALLTQASEEKSFAWLRPLKASLTPLDASLVRTLQGHTGWVTAVAVTPDGRYLVSGSDDKTLRVWDLETGDTTKTLRGHTGAVTALAVTPNGRYVVSGSQDKTLRVWDLETGENTKTLDGHTWPVTAVAVTPNSRHLVSGSKENTLWVWDLETGDTAKMLHGHASSVTAVAVSPDGRNLVSGSDDGTLRVWDLDTGKTAKTLQGHTGLVAAVAVTPDGRHLVSSSKDNTLRVWDLETGKTTKTLQGHTRSVIAVAVTPDGRRLATGSNDKTLRLWNLETAETIKMFQGHTRSVTAVAVTPDGRRLVSGAADKTLRVWELETGETTMTLPGAIFGIAALAVTPNGRHLVSGSGDNTLRIWDLETGKITKILQGHTSSVAAVAVTPDGRHLVSGSGDNTLRVWDLETGKTIKTLQGHSFGVTAVAVTPDGRHLVSGSYDKTLRVWDLETAKTTKTLQGHTSSVTAVAVTPNGRHLISGSDDRTLRVWDLETAKTAKTFHGHAGSVATVAVTPDGRHLISGSGDNTLRVWDLETGETTKTLQGHTDWVNTAAVTPDGRRLVSGSYDNTLRVWNLKDGQELVTFTVDGNVTTCIVAQDSRTVVAGDSFDRLHFLRLEGVD